MSGFSAFPRGSSIERRIDTRLPATRYFWPISPRGEELACTLLTVVSVLMVALSAKIDLSAGFDTLADPVSVRSDLAELVSPWRAFSIRWWCLPNQTL